MNHIFLKLFTFDYPSSQWVDFNVKELECLNALSYVLKLKLRNSINFRGLFNQESSIAAIYIKFNFIILVFSYKVLIFFYLKVVI